MALDTAPVTPEAEDRTLPPRRPSDPRTWVRENLFNSRFNSALTVVFGALLAWAAYRALRFVFVTAEWDIVRRNLTLLMVGRFPRDELWRPVASLFAVAATIGLAAGAAATVAAEEAVRAGRPPVRDTWQGRARRYWPLLLLGVVLVGFAETITPVLVLLGVLSTGAVTFVVGRRMPAEVRRFSWLLVAAGLFVSFWLTIGFGGVGWDRWGGLQLTLFVTVAGIALAFPLGLLLALGRRSTLPVVRAVSVTYIEVFRGVPLLALLLMGQLIIGFFLPSGITPPGIVVRAIIVIVIFEAAYIAEIVRGGLQSVPKGQVEAAQALGLSPWRITRTIVLPQALRAVIPAMVGQFISLYQDTSLLAAIGLMELLDAGRTTTSQPEFVGQGLQAVVLPFVGFIYWAVSYSMSRESQRLERRLGVGER
jgi:general L-amino acid transport system permease protein